MTDFEDRVRNEMIEDEVGRNDPCPCGSGRKFKKCCGRKTKWPPEGLKGAVRMKGGVAFDPVKNVYRAVIHSWDTPEGEGEPHEWESEQTFSSEDAAMSFYKGRIRPLLERLMKKAEREHGAETFNRRLEE
ncbi:MAG: SEC-C metal-binding domain-containing protein [Planctomycetota bacterium]